MRAQGRSAEGERGRGRQRESDVRSRRGRGRGTYQVVIPMVVYRMPGRMGELMLVMRGRDERKR